MELTTCDGAALYNYHSPAEEALMTATKKSLEPGKNSW
jgi:hypothetical protein